MAEGPEGIDAKVIRMEREVWVGMMKYKKFRCQLSACLQPLFLIYNNSPRGFVAAGVWRFLKNGQNCHPYQGSGLPGSKMPTLSRTRLVSSC